MLNAARQGSHALVRADHADVYLREVVGCQCALEVEHDRRQRRTQFVRHVGTETTLAFQRIFLTAQLFVQSAQYGLQFKRRVFERNGLAAAGLARGQCGCQRHQWPQAARHRPANQQGQYWQAEQEGQAVFKP